MKEYAFGIDLGGTTAKVGLFTTSGALLEKWEVRKEQKSPCCRQPASMPQQT